STISAASLPEYQPPSPIIPQYAASCTFVKFVFLVPSVFTNGAKFSACDLLTSYFGILLKLLPKPTIAFLNFSCFSFLVGSNKAEFNLPIQSQPGDVPVQEGKVVFPIAALDKSAVVPLLGSPSVKT